MLEALPVGQRRIIIFEPGHDKTKRMTCAPSEYSDQAWWVSAWASAVPTLATHWAQSRKSDQAAFMCRLIWVFAWRTCHLVSVVLRLIYFFHRPVCKWCLRCLSVIMAEARPFRNGPPLSDSLVWQLATPHLRTGGVTLQKLHPLFPRITRNQRHFQGGLIKVNQMRAAEMLQICHPERTVATPTVYREKRLKLIVRI